MQQKSKLVFTRCGSSPPRRHGDRGGGTGRQQGRTKPGHRGPGPGTPEAAPSPFPTETFFEENLLRLSRQVSAPSLLLREPAWHAATSCTLSTATCSLPPRPPSREHAELAWASQPPAHLHLLRTLLTRPLPSHTLSHTLTHARVRTHTHTHAHVHTQSHTRTPRSQRTPALPTLKFPQSSLRQKPSSWASHSWPGARRPAHHRGLPPPLSGRALLRLFARQTSSEHLPAARLVRSRGCSTDETKSLSQLKRRREYRTWCHRVAVPAAGKAGGLQQGWGPGRARGAFPEAPQPCTPAPRPSSHPDDLCFCRGRTGCVPALQEAFSGLCSQPPPPRPIFPNKLVNPLTAEAVPSELPTRSLVPGARHKRTGRSQLTYRDCATRSRPSARRLTCTHRHLARQGPYCTQIRVQPQTVGTQVPQKSPARGIP